MFSKIFIKALLSILILIIIYAIFMFAFVVPNIEKNTINLEVSLGKAQLEKTVQIVRSAHIQMRLYAKSALLTHKNELKRLTSIVWQVIEIEQKESRSLGPKGILQTQQEILNLIAKLKYSDDDYFFVSNYNSVLISHPYLQNKDFSHVRDIYGNFIVPPMVYIARKNGDGFTKYWWKKNNGDPKIYEKLSFVKNFKPWHWVVGTGVYINDINKEIKRRKAALIERLRVILNDTKIGKSGYVYIFDSHANMIIHPNKSLEGKKFDKMLNPGTKTYIFNDLVNAYKHGDKKLYYLWDKPNDQGNFIYKKVSWIHYDSYFKWYICSSGYVGEFHEKSIALKRYLLLAISFIAIFIVLIGLYFLRRILYPIVELSKNVKQIREGDLNARYKGPVNDDETGILATQFNQMLDTINDQITTLDLSVQEKTKELSKSLGEKEVLLKELHHRVKNNLFVISGIIGLQAFQEKEISRDELMQNIQNKIQAIALAHEMLNNKGKHIVNMTNYVKKLTKTLFLAFTNDDKIDRCSYEIEDIKLSLDQVYPIGLIINELVTNAIKYTFKHKDNHLTISLHLDEENFVILSIEDDGTGFDSSKKQGLGLQLVEMSVKQLGGKIYFHSNHGTKIHIKFPLN